MHVLSKELLGVGGAAVRLVSVVQRLGLYRPSTDAALGLDLLDSDFGAVMDLDAPFGRRPGEARRLAQDELGGALRLEQGRSGKQSCGGEAKLAMGGHGSVLVIPHGRRQVLWWDGASPAQGPKREKPSMEGFSFVVARARNVQNFNITLRVPLTCGAPALEADTLTRPVEESQAPRLRRVK
jgi:hypothetical protein